MPKITISHLFPTADVPPFREAIAQLQDDEKWQVPGPEIVTEYPWHTIPGREQVLVIFNVFSGAQAFALGWAWADKKREGRDE
jgi:hypothetical protein